MMNQSCGSLTDELCTQTRVAQCRNCVASLLIGAIEHSTPMRSSPWRGPQYSNGNCCKGRHAPKTSAQTRRGPTGFCPCCTVATPVPALFTPEACSQKKAISITIWRRRGPCAVRRYRAGLHAQDGQKVTNNLDLAARNPTMPEPPVPRAINR